MPPSPTPPASDAMEPRERVLHALSRFVFPGQLVPRFEMADAVLAALDHGDDYVEYLPAKHIVRSVENEALDVLLSLVVEHATTHKGGTTHLYRGFMFGREHRIWALWGEWRAGAQSVDEAREALKDVIRAALLEQAGGGDSHG